jgi:methyl-accepting chemotaxis protein
VAEEIRKLATNSADSVKNIDRIIKTIQSESVQSYDQLTHVNEAIRMISVSITEVAGAVQKTVSLVQKLDEVADSFSKEAK